MRVRAPLALLLAGGVLLGGPVSAATVTGPLDDRQDACPTSRLLDPQFADVSTDNVFRYDIVCVENYGVAAGKDTQPPTYGPGEPVLRKQMALFVWRLLNGMGVAPQDSADHGFADVPASFRPVGERDAINALANAGVVHGVDATHFDPDGVVRRDQMATFLVNAQARVDGGFSTGEDYFVDDGPDVHQPAINALAAAGITAGCAAGAEFYCPLQPVTRGQMAGFLARDLEADIRRLDVEPVYVEDQQYRVRPIGDVAVPPSTPQRYAFDVVPGETYAVALFPCGDVTTGSFAYDRTSDTYADPFTDVFADRDGDGRADDLGRSDHGGAHISAVNDAAVAGTVTSDFDVTPTAGSARVAVTVVSPTADCAVPVLFLDTDADHALGLDAVDQPAEPYAAPAELRWG